jgi:hypothetical protein
MVEKAPLTKNSTMANNKKEISIAEVRGRLLELIFGMSEEESRSLLTELQKRRQPKKEIEEKRKHPKSKTFIHNDNANFFKLKRMLWNFERIQWKKLSMHLECQNKENKNLILQSL